MQNVSSVRPDMGVFIGRFQPLHQGHLRVIRKGLASASNLAVLLGSAGNPEPIEIPF